MLTDHKNAWEIIFKLSRIYQVNDGNAAYVPCSYFVLNHCLLAETNSLKTLVSTSKLGLKQLAETRGGYKISAQIIASQCAV